MSTTEIKEKLQTYIEHGDDRLLKLMLALAKEYTYEDDSYEFTEEEIKKFEESRATYLKGEGKFYSMEEALAIMKKGFPPEK